MTRFGINGIYNKELSFFGKFAFFIHGNPHIAKFLQRYYFIKNLKRIISNKTENILDIGCGSGDYSFFLAEKYTALKIDAIEKNNKNIENALEVKEIKKYDKLNFILSDFQSFKFKKKYDSIFCVEMLHAVEDKSLFLKKISEIIEKEGFFYFQDCIKGDYNKFILNKSPKQFKEYCEKFFKGKQLSEEEIFKILNELNFEILKNGRIIGFFGQLAWEIDQISAVNIKYLKTLLIPVLKTLCQLDFLLNLGRKNELFIVARKIK